jgi:hypothetical protein
MAGIGAAAIPDDYIGILGKNINHLALALITPLQTSYANIHLFNYSTESQQR